MTVECVQILHFPSNPVFPLNVEFDSRVIDIQLPNAQTLFKRPFSSEVVDLSASGCQLFSVHMTHMFLEVKLVQISDVSKQFM